MVSKANLYLTITFSILLIIPSGVILISNNLLGTNKVAYAQANQMRSNITNSLSIEGISAVRANPEYKTQLAITGIKLSGHPYFISVNPDINMIYVAGILPKKVFFIDGNTEREIKTIVIPDTKSYNSSSFNSRILLLSAIAVKSTTNLVFVSYTDTSTIYVIDESGGDVVAYDVIGNTPRALAADPDSKVSDVYAITDIVKPNQRGGDFVAGTNRVYLINAFFNVLNSNITIGKNDILSAIAVNPILEGTGKAIPIKTDISISGL